MDDYSPLDYAAFIQELDELDRILAQSDVRQVVDAQPDLVDDSSPVDVAAMIQDIDELDQILAGIEYANHTETKIT